ncbi:MAG: GNAT family N-acetyltransferase [Sphingobacterium sp.]
MVKYSRFSLVKYCSRSDIFTNKTQKIDLLPENWIIQNKRLEIGWTWIGEKFQGTGINAVCKGLLLDYCFDNLNLRRVEFKIDINNLKSEKTNRKDWSY